MAVGKKGKWKLITGIAAGIAVLGLGGWYLLGSKDAVQAQPVTAAVTKGTIDVKVSGTGNVEPADTSNVIAKAGGNIYAISVANGQHVNKGQLLFKLDDSQLRTQIEKARLDQKQTQIDMDKSKDQLKEQQVYAPMGGRITSIQVTEGQDVQKGAVMLTIMDISSLTFDVPFSDVSSIKVGQKADVTITDLGASGLTGRVTKVNRNAVAGTDGTLVYYVTIMIDNPGALVPGMQSQAAVHTDKGPIYGYTTGPLKWADTNTIRAGISGKLTQLKVEENTVVKKGQLLASLYADSVESQANSQSLKLQQSQLNISDLEKQLPDYSIYASSDGIFTMTASSDTSGTNRTNSGSASSADVSDKWQVGDEIKKGQIVGVINNSNGMVVTVSVDEVDIAKIKLGQKAEITFDALPNQKFTGSVSYISEQGVVSNNAATFDVKVALDKTDGVKTGMTANVEILVNYKEGALLVPIEAVQDRGGQKFVILDAGGAADNTGRPGSGSGGPGAGERLGAGGPSGSGDRAESGTAGGAGNGQGMRVRAGNAGADNAGAGNAIGGRMTPVETGLYNETLIEITKGVTEGDKVVLPAVARNSGNNSGVRMPIGGGMGGSRQVYTSGPRPGGGGR